MNRLKAVFFDMDGTLVDSVGAIGTVCNRILEKYGFPPHELSEYKRFVGRGIRQAIQNAVGCPVEDSLLNRMTDDFLEEYEKDPFSQTAAYPGMRELVSRTADAGILCFIVTNKAQPIAQIISDGLFGSSVAAVVGFRESLPPKPAPDGVLSLLNRFEISADEALFVGDSGIDWQTARNSSLPVAIMTWGYADEEFFRKNPPDFLCESAADLEKIIFTKG